VQDLSLQVNQNLQMSKLICTRWVKILNHT